jgi:HAE1 family hydrophobic/amphiphilic exporter-1
LILFGLGIVFVFLTLAAQYENWVDPLIILLTVPLAILGALLSVLLKGTANDVYTQIGFVMLVGMASKNAILIVEFANEAREQGLGIAKAMLEACRERLRPILMTAISTIIGAVPLLVATGPGAAARQSLGTAIVGGMGMATILSLFIVPALYVFIKSLEARWQTPSSALAEASFDSTLDGHNRDGHYPGRQMNDFSLIEQDKQKKEH